MVQWIFFGPRFKLYFTWTMMRLELKLMQRKDFSAIIDYWQSDCIRRDFKAILHVFLKNSKIVLVLMIVTTVISFLVPQAQFWIGVIFLVIPIFAVFKPLPKLFLGNRIFSACVAFFVGWTHASASYNRMTETNRLAELRATNPIAYLDELKTRNQDKWLAELEQIDPERHAQALVDIENANKKAKLDAEALELKRISERSQREADRQKEIAAQIQKDKINRKIAYVERLDHEIAGLENFRTADYTTDMTAIKSGIIYIGTLGDFAAKGDNFEFDAQANERRKYFLAILSKTQSTLLPALRDAFGPAMREQLWESNGTAKTVGKGFKTVEFVSGAFVLNRNIKTVHLELYETLMMLRFTTAKYKWTEGKSNYTFFELRPPNDSEIVKWDNNAAYRVIK